MLSRIYRFVGSRFLAHMERHGFTFLAVDHLNAINEDRKRMREALAFQRDALYIVRDRQGGTASKEDLTKGIRLINNALGYK